MPSVDAATSSSLRDLVKSGIGPQIHRTIGERRSGECSTWNFILAQSFKLYARLDPGGDTSFVQEQDSPVGQNWRCGKVAPQTFHPMPLTGFRIDTRSDPVVGNEKEFVAHQQR